MLLVLVVATGNKEDTVAELNDEWLVARYYFFEAAMRKTDEGVSAKGDTALACRLGIDINKLKSTGRSPPLAGTLPAAQLPPVSWPPEYLARRKGPRLRLLGTDTACAVFALGTKEGMHGEDQRAAIASADIACLAAEQTSGPSLH